MRETFNITVFHFLGYLFKKKPRNLDADNTVPENNGMPITEMRSEPYETCVPFKPSNILSANEDPSKILTHYLSCRSYLQHYNSDDEHLL